MAGAIIAHQRLMGVAPNAHVVAIHAFSAKASSPESTTFSILKGLDYAVAHNLRLVNMSFAGPRDPTLERAIKAAYDKNVIMIAAAGNAGPKSPPLYPGADPNVIAVTATDWTTSSSPAPTAASTSPSQRRASTSWCRRRTAPISSPPALPSRPLTSPASWP
jgi:hypothetical protein